MNESSLKDYDFNILKMTPAQIFSILKSYGLQAIFDFNKLPDTGEGVLTKKIYLQRKAACTACPIKRGNVCSIQLTRTHVSLKEADSSPKFVSGCGCGLKAKQVNIDKHCPAGEW